MPFANLGNLLGDLDFWGGVAEGASEQIRTQEDRKDKDIRELRNFGITRGMQIEEDNRSAINAAEVQVKELASLISGDRSANAPEVMEAAYYLIDQEGGIAGANRVAKLLNTEYSTYGVDPITKMGLQERSIGEVPTARDVARTVTRLKPLPDIKASGIETRRTALDVIFGSETAEDQISSEMAEMFGTDQATMAEMSPVSATGIDEELILGTNFNNELVRMNTLLNKHNQVPPQSRDAEWTAVEGVIKSNIEMLSEAKKMAELQQNQMSDSSRETFEKGFMRNLVSAGQLKGDFDVAGNYEAKGVKAEIYGKAVASVATMGKLAQLARNNGYVGIDANGNRYDPIEFIKKLELLSK